MDVVKGSAVLLCQDGELCKVGKKWAVYVMAFHSGGGEEQRWTSPRVMHQHLKRTHLSNSSPYSQVFIDSTCMLIELFLHVLRFFASFVVCSFLYFRQRLSDRQ